jgi:hypothetical protein
MALYFSEGFDNYAAAADFALGGWTKINDGSDLYITLDSTGSRWGGPCIKIESRTTQASIHKTIPVAMSGTTLRFAFWLKTSVNHSAGILGGSQIPLFALEDSGGTSFLDVKLCPLGAEVDAAGGGLLVTRTENARSGLASYINNDLPSKKRVVDGEWHHVELAMTINTSTGTATLWIDGEEQYALTGIDTQDAASNISTYVRVRLSSSVAANTVEYVWFDDIMVWDDSGSEFTGALPNHIHRIETIRPGGAGAAADFTPSAGSNFQNVDETVADDDTTYNESSTTGHIDSFAYGNMSLSADEIFGINIKSRVKFDSGAANFRNKTRISSTYYNGTTVAAGAAYALVETIYNNNPASTGSNLTVSDINAAEFGYERVV